MYAQLFVNTRPAVCDVDFFRAALDESEVQGQSSSLSALAAAPRAAA
jgi:hypothetical protein